MPKDRDYTPYQKGIIRRYYDNKDTLMQQKLGEIVSDLYLCTEGKKADRLWERAHRALLNAGANETHATRLLVDRDLEGLAKLVGELF
jgi:hypothetical protein